MAQVYRWTDDNGRIHYTDNPETIPPHRRAASRLLAPSDAGQPSEPPPAPQTSPPAVVSTQAPSATVSEDASRLQQRVQLLEQQIATVLQKRQQLLDQIKAVRAIRTNPAFGQERRRVDAPGRELATVEHQLDALYAELHDAQAALQEREQIQHQGASAHRPSGEVALDTQGHDQAYWRQRAASLQARLQQVREQRQAILAQLAPETEEERSAFGRRGREVLQLVQALEQTWQDLRAAEAAWLALQQEASQAGAPAAWLQ
jgi:Domain of unknown function (DUF4124)